MPRTRSKKIAISEDDTVSSSQMEQDENAITTRPPFAEISNPIQAVTVEEMETAYQVKDLKAAFKTAIGLKKKSRRNKGKRQVASAENTAPEIVEDNLAAASSPAAQATRQILNSVEENHFMAKEYPSSSMSSASAAVPQQLLSQTGQLNGSILLSRTGSHTGHLTLASAINSPSYDRSVRAWVSNQLATPRNFTADRWLKLAEESILHEGKVLQTSQNNHAQDDHMMQSPVKAIMSFASVEKACEELEVTSPRVDSADDEDSFVGQITCRSPAKPVSRIEDSVEALDNLEEAIEALGDVASGQRIVSPSTDEGPSTSPSAFRRLTRSPTDISLAAIRATKVAASASDKLKSTKPLITGPANKPAKITKSSSTPKDALTVTTKSVASHEQLVASKKPVKRPASLLPPKERPRTVKPVTRPIFELPGEAVARKLKEQREARVLQRETSLKPATPPKVKSTKQLTVPTFELPGEALSRKKREQHEARLKAKEEEERQRREFKAKPVRKSIVPNLVPRDTAASRARKSQLGVPDFENAVTGRPYNSLTVAKRGSNVGSHRPSILPTNVANSSAPRAPGPNRTDSSLARKVSTTSGPSMSGLAKQRTVSASDVQIQRQRAKDIYQREAKMIEEQEKEKREREAAAKKSREEAAERGRKASREWAEKQRTKQAKGPLPGHGPVEQLGQQ